MRGFLSVQTAFGELVGLVAGRDYAQIVALRSIALSGHTDGEGVATCEVVRRQMRVVHAYGQLVVVGYAAPGGAHGVGLPVRAICGDYKDGLRVQPGLYSEVLAHWNSS